jgi:hypothetical protein
MIKLDDDDDDDDEHKPVWPSGLWAMIKLNNNKASRY